MAYVYPEKIKNAPFWTRKLTVFLLGVISAAGLAPVSWPIAFLFGFAFFAFLARHAQNAGQVFAEAWFYALGYHLAGLYWISASLFIDIARYVWVLPFSLLALPAYLALLFAGCAAPSFLLRGKPLLHALALAALVFASEVLRGILMTGFPWNLFGYVWTETLPLLQSASLIGIHGLTLLTLLLAALSGLLFERMTKAAWLALAVTAAIFSGLALWGEARLDATPTAYEEKYLVRLVQPAIAQHERKTEEQRILGMSKTITLSKQPSAKPLTAILWPETASPFFLAQHDDVRAALLPIIPKNGVLISGAPSRTEENGNRRYYNSLIVINDKAAVAGIYDKSHLVPFGEFVPLREILKTIPVAADVIGSGDFSPGTGAKTLRAPGIPPFSTMICYEAIFSGAIVDEHDPPALLVQITNDAWFGNTSGPYQHLAMARVRAIEEGLPLVRVANTGISAVIDPLGRTLQSLPLNSSGIIDSPLPKALPEQTIFARLWARFFMTN